MCCGLFSSKDHILRLLEIILCAMTFSIATYHGALLHPYGVWCVFTWIFAFGISLFILIMEIMKWKDLLVICLPKWDDFTCSMTMLCSLMMLSASFIYALQYTRLLWIDTILCAVVSFVGLIIYVVHAAMAKMSCPNGYLSNIPGFLRVLEAFVANIILSSVSSYFLNIPQEYRPGGMIWCSLIYSACFITTVVIIVLHLVKFLNIVCCPLDKVELVLNVVVVLMYLSAAITWPLYGYYFKHECQETCYYCCLVDATVVMVMTVINLILYMVDLVYSIIAVTNRI